MDKADAVKKFESFQVEAAARKAFRSLLEHFEKVDRDMQTKTEKVSTVADLAKKRTD